ncbi:DSD1 family PLP-dependent enzyme [Collimonas silvisoli]|uniref:DSD1 family PLP-dependent enzyme n=1 Tax=Collimonas silvisoli TaxID=2825884 RepID=UPI001B8C141C|nr:DSD1 family PLP-dependent enzyme [Collimonas silvisoli]
MDDSSKNTAHSLSDLETPALVLDQNRMAQNVDRMRASLARFDVAFRPHVKTSKSIQVTRSTLGQASGPITVSTLKEAEYFSASGFTDILYAVGIVPGKFDHVIRLRRQGVKLTVILDSLEMAQALCGKARQENTRFDVMIEIDSDGHRSGVVPDSPQLLDIGRCLVAGGQYLAGVVTHAGNSYNCRSIPAIRQMAQQERDAAVGCADRLRAAGIACPTVSIGSTPTAMFADNLDGVSEVRAGVFVFGDLVMAGLGVCRQQDIALSVLTTVIGHQKEKGWIITDAGWMAMSRDRGTSKQAVDQGYGLICGLDGELLPDMLVVDANQEHGVIAHRFGDPAQTPALPIGTMLRILPNHACATGAQHSRYHVVNRNSSDIVEIWERFRGW